MRQCENDHKVIEIVTFWANLNNSFCKINQVVDDFEAAVSDSIVTGSVFDFLNLTGSGE